MTVPPWLALAEKELDVSEIPGPIHNPRILEYHACTTLKATDDETPWCSSFVNWCMYHAGFMPTRSAAARSWLDWGLRLTEPVQGCIVVFRRGSSPTAGHVAFFKNMGRHGQINVLGGNQNDRVCYSNYRLSDVLGYVWPKGYQG